MDYDDGAVVYLNGVELFRANLPAGTVSYSTLASTSLEDTLVVYPINPSALATGTNILAVEVHQESASSNDCHFELRLVANKAAGQTVWRKYYYAGGSRIAMREGLTTTGTTGLSFLLGDHLGSTNVRWDATTGQKVAELRYKPWGQVRYSAGNAQTTFRFTGQREEAGLDMYYYGARWYDPYLYSHRKN
jgi:hypothetical protein